MNEATFPENCCLIYILRIPEINTRHYSFGILNHEKDPVHTDSVFYDDFFLMHKYSVLFILWKK
jgi:hypothetical protein